MYEYNARISVSLYVIISCLNAFFLYTLHAYTDSANPLSLLKLRASELWIGTGTLNCSCFPCTLTFNTKILTLFLWYLFLLYRLQSLIRLDLSGVICINFILFYCSYSICRPCANTSRSAASLASTNWNLWNTSQLPKVSINARSTC